MNENDALPLQSNLHYIMYFSICETPEEKTITWGYFGCEYMIFYIIYLFIHCQTTTTKSLDTSQHTQLYNHHKITVTTPPRLPLGSSITCCTRKSRPYSVFQWSALRAVSFVSFLLTVCSNACTPWSEQHALLPCVPSIASKKQPVTLAAYGLQSRGDDLTVCVHRPWWMARAVGSRAPSPTRPEHDSAGAAKLSSSISAGEQIAVLEWGFRGLQEGSAELNGWAVSGRGRWRWWKEKKG